MTDNESRAVINGQKKNKLIGLFTTKEFLVRLLSALAMAFVTISLTFYSFNSFLLLAAFMMGFMCWEWASLTNNDEPLQIVILIATITITMLAAIYKEWPLFLASLLAGGLLSCWSTHYWWRAKWALIGLAYLFLPLLSLIYLRADPEFGFYAVLFVLIIVWSTDTIAYFTGRYFGGKKLAEQISPNKTWAGFYGGLFAGFIVGAMFALSIDQEPVILSLIGLLLSALSQAGDLAESGIKRHFGVKDTSNLIPGHGGVLDRLDGVIFAAVGAAIIAALHNFDKPGQALLIWSS